MTISPLTRALVLTLAAFVPGLAAAADGPNPTARRAAVKFSPLAACEATAAFNDLKASYFTNHADAVKAARTLLQCASSITTDGPVVVMFFLKPTSAADDPTLIHIMVDKNATGERFDLLGQNPAWLYVTDDKCDQPPVVELSMTKAENPVKAQIGSLAKALIPTIPVQVGRGAAEAGGSRCASAPLRFAVGSASLPYRRGVVTETTYVQRVVRNEAGRWLDADKKETNIEAEATWVQLGGSTEYSSTPLSRMSFLAGAAGIIGPVKGARQMAIEDDKFTSDPVGRVVTIAGISWHRAFDGTLPEPSTRERWGFFTGGVLTPSAGVAAGVTVNWRGIGLILGWAEMWVKSAPKGVNEGAAVPEGGTLVLRPTGGVLFGATYTFED